ncbi:hypothetical protein D3C81_2104900 [compost metagenome]
MVGISHGFVTEWGPIIWGLLAAVGGFIIGYSVFALLHFKLWRRDASGKRPEAVVIVRGRLDQENLIRQVLWSHHALSVGVVAGQTPADGNRPAPTTSA